MHHIGHQHYLNSPKTGRTFYHVLYWHRIDSFDKGLCLSKDRVKKWVKARSLTHSCTCKTTRWDTWPGDRKMPSPYSYGEETFAGLYGLGTFADAGSDICNTLRSKVDLEGVNHYQLSFTVAKTSYKILSMPVRFDFWSVDWYLFSEWILLFAVGKIHLPASSTHCMLCTRATLFIRKQWDVYRRSPLEKNLRTTLGFLKQLTNRLSPLDEIKKAPLNKTKCEWN